MKCLKKSLRLHDIKKGGIVIIKWDIFKNKIYVIADKKDVKVKDK